MKNVIALSNNISLIEQISLKRVQHSVKNVGIKQRISPGFPEELILVVIFTVTFRCLTEMRKNGIII